MNLDWTLRCEKAKIFKINFMYVVHHHKHKHNTQRHQTANPLRMQFTDLPLEAGSKSRSVLTDSHAETPKL